MGLWLCWHLSITKIRVQRGQGRAVFRVADLSLYHHTEEGARKLPDPLWLRALIPLMRAPPSLPNHLTKVPPTSIIPLGIVSSTLEFRGGHERLDIAAGSLSCFCPEPWGDPPTKGQVWGYREDTVYPAWPQVHRLERLLIKGTEHHEGPTSYCGHPEGLSSFPPSPPSFLFTSPLIQQIFLEGWTQHHAVLRLHLWTGHGLLALQESATEREERLFFKWPQQQLHNGKSDKWSHMRYQRSWDLSWCHGGSP